MQTRTGAPADEPPSLDQRIAALEERMARLELAASLITCTAVQGPRAQAPPGPPGQERATLAGVLGLLGRTSLVLAGAFLIRAFTESGALPRAGGAALGLAYAAAWAAAADRAGARGRRLGAGWHALTCALIAYPLLWEATARFRILPPAGAAGLLLALTALLMAVAWRRALEGIAWTAALCSLGTGFALMAATSAIPAYCALFLLFAGASLALADRPGWRDLRWPAALTADAAVLTMAVLAAHPGGSLELARNLRTPAVPVLAVALVLVYLASFAGRALVRPRSVRAFELVQTLAVLPIGLGGALWTARGAAAGPGLAALAMGLACYGSAFTFLRRQAEGSSDFRFLASLALALVLIAGPALLPPGWLALPLAALGLASAALGRRFGRRSLMVHGAVYLAAAALASGLLAAVWGAFTAPAPAGPPPAALLVLAALAAGHLLLLGSGPWGQRLPCFALGALCLAGLAALAVAAAPALDPGALAALRTAVLALAAVAAGALGRFVPGAMGWMVHPLLGATAVKLLAQDVPRGGPVSLTLALACFGSALLVAPRLARAGRPGPDEKSGTADQDLLK